MPRAQQELVQFLDQYLPLYNLADIVERIAAEQTKSFDAEAMLVALERALFTLAKRTPARCRHCGSPMTAEGCASRCGVVN